MITPQATPLEAAERYATLGWSVVPIAPGLKHPQLPGWQDKATTELDTIRQWWTGPYQGHGVGIATGPKSGLWVLDVDVADGKLGYESLTDLVSRWGGLPDTVIARTGTNGAHIYFRWSLDRIVTAGLATHLPAGLDIRGVGGQVVAPPTIHPNGQAYRWETGRDPWSVDLAQGPTWLYGALFPPPDPGRQLTTATEFEDSIAEWIAQTTEWHPTLEAAGWTLHSYHGRDTWWTRPGKDRRRGHSAVLHEPDGPLVVFSTEVDRTYHQAGIKTTDGSGYSLSLFAFVAATRHGGDRSAAASEARKYRNRLDAARASQGVAEAPWAVPIPQALASPVELLAEPLPGFSDMGHWWDNPEPTKIADVFPVGTTGPGLLYSDCLNWIHGDSGSGKTWIALAAACDMVRKGRHVAWIHYEDPTPATVIARLQLLGLTREQVVERFHYYDPQGEAVPWIHLLELCQEQGVAMAFLDSVGEAMNIAGVVEDSDAEVGPWIVNGPRRFVDAGIGFTCIDHGTKDRRGGGGKLYPSGSKRKRAAVTGTALYIEAVDPPTLSRDGMLKVICAKDRHGNHASATVAAYVRVTHTTTGLVIKADAPRALDEEEARVQEVVQIVTNDPGRTYNEVALQMSTAGRQRKLDAIQEAVNAGHLVERDGARGSRKLYPPSA